MQILKHEILKLHTKKERAYHTLYNYLQQRLHDIITDINFEDEAWGENVDYSIDWGFLAKQPCKIFYFFFRFFLYSYIQ